MLDNILNPFWKQSAKMLPLWMAPNLVTLVGFSVLSTLLVLTFMYDHQLEGKSPSWVYFVFSVAVIMCQTLDAMDGKQARRTNSSSPLGQLFDHGCDAMSAVCMCIAACNALGLGATFTTASFLRLRSFSTLWLSGRSTTLTFYVLKQEISALQRFSSCCLPFF